ncbi:L-ribulose-5-phosphate 3-epimerase [Alkalibaculum sporogenes]|nr:L-ribulose-5-phosphate 3-epimerase [Alkalibaculum sporogenes]
MNINKIPIGIYEKALSSKLDWMEKLTICSVCGYDFLEICIDECEDRLERLYWDKSQKIELKDAMKRTEIPILSMCLSVHRKYPIGSGLIEIREKGMEIMEKAIQFSIDFGIRVIQIAGYDVYYSESTEETKKIFKENLFKATELARKANVVLAIENMDTIFINTPTKIMDYIEEIKSPFLQCYPDVGNISAWHLNMEEELGAIQKHIVGMHLKDTIEQVFRRIDFGKGIVDFEEAFKILNKISYKGPFVIEMWSDDNDDYVEKMIYARRMIEEKMKLACYY